MKTLLLMRHAKSSWKIKDIPDHERPLTKRGRKDAPRIGSLLADQELVPQLILSSSALRARQTAELVAETSGYTEEVLSQDRLYMAEVEEYFSILHGLSDNIERVMVIGHNPGIETLLQVLSNRIESLPTAVLAHIVLPLDEWQDLNKDVQGELIQIWRPKELVEESDGEEKIEEKKEKVKGKEKTKAKEKSQGKAKEKKKKDK
jgi:phosphohistidine phosphatase